jgi:hypothetical protein
MLLEGIIVLIVLVPIVSLVLLWRRKELRTNLPIVLLLIFVNFLFVAGIIMLFPAFYMMFHEKVTGFSIGFLVVSLFLVFGGYIATKWVNRR